MCNLACLHCYSESSPNDREHADVEQLLAAASRLRAFGYEIASLSGGEPTVYRDFYRLCAGLKAQDYKISVITNGLLLKPIMQVVEAGLTDLVSVSFDGPADIHNQIRGRADCFEKATATLQTLANRGVDVGAVVSVTQQSFAHIPALVETLIDYGAKRIQLHPIAVVGRALHGALRFDELSPLDLQAIILIGILLQSQYPHVTINCDAVMGAELRQKAFPSATDLVSPLVIDETGTLLPIAYGMSKTLSFGTVQKGFSPPIYGQKLAKLAKATMLRCSQQMATTFYAALVRASIETEAKTRQTAYRDRLPKMPRTSARPNDDATERATDFMAASVTV